MKAIDWNDYLHQKYLASIQIEDVRDAYIKFCEFGFRLHDYICKVAVQGAINVV